MEPSTKLMNARCRLMTREPWYGHVAMNINWIPSEMPWIPEEQRTMGVRIVNDNDVQCMYYPPFVDSMTLEECYAVVQHEIEHLVRLHCIRVDNRHREAWNIAADMTVNGRRNAPRIGYRESRSNDMIVPLKGNIVWIPDDWPDGSSSEQYYDMLLKKQSGPICNRCGKPVGGGQGNKKGKGKGGEKGEKGEEEKDGEGGGGEADKDEHKCPGCGQDHNGQYSFGGVSGKAIDNHDIWQTSDVSEDTARQIVNGIVQDATAKNQGSAPGHLTEAIKKLGKPVVRWRELLRNFVGRHVGSRRKTYSRTSRRVNMFGTPGISHHATATVTVIVDTSGSIGQAEMSQFFAEIDAISGKAKVNVLQWDYVFQGYKPYRAGDWKKFEFKGRGGTAMDQAVLWVVKNKVVPDCLILITDGYTGWPEKQDFPFITCITTPEGSTTGPSWGKVIRI